MVLETSLTYYFVVAYYGNHKKRLFGTTTAEFKFHET